MVQNINPLCAELSRAQRLHFEKRLESEFHAKFCRNVVVRRSRHRLLLRNQNLFYAHYLSQKINWDANKIPVGINSRAQRYKKAAKTE